MDDGKQQGAKALTVAAKASIVSDPAAYLADKSKTLDDRLNGISLSENAVDAISGTRSLKLVRDKVLGLFKIGELINAVLTFNEEVDQDIREAKKERLLADYFNKADATASSVRAIRLLLTDPQGNTLFNKVLRILDDSPPDLELMGHLGSALKHIADSDFARLFEQHKYALSQIESLTPQALTILSDYARWPTMQLNSYSSNGGRVTSDWLNEFTAAYAQSKGITDPATRNRLQHSINDLTGQRLVEAYLSQEKIAECRLTSIGQSLLPYIRA